MKNNFIQRAITGIIFVGVLIGCILGGPISFSLLFALITALTIHEFGVIISKQPDVEINKPICMLAGVFLFFGFAYLGVMPGQTEILIPYLFLIIYLLVSELYLKKKNPLNNWAYAMMSQIYIALSFAMLNVLEVKENCQITKYSTTQYCRCQYLFSHGLMIREHIVPVCYSENIACLSEFLLKNHGKVPLAAEFSVL